MKIFFLYYYEWFSNNFFKKFISAFVFLTKLKKPFSKWLTGHHVAPLVTLLFLLSPCYLQDTMPSQWSSNDVLPRVLRIWVRFFILHSFLLVLRPLWDWQFSLNIIRASCWYFRNIYPIRLFVWIATIHNKKYRVTSI